MDLLRKAHALAALGPFALVLAACVEAGPTGPTGPKGEPGASAPECVPGAGDEPIPVPSVIGESGFVRNRQRPHEGMYEHALALPADDVLRARVWIQRPGDTHPAERHSMVGATAVGTTYTLEVTPATGKVRMRLVGHGYGHGDAPPPAVVESVQRQESSHPGPSVLDYAVAALDGVKVYVRVCPRA